MNTKEPFIHILLSTYNGEKYLNTQLSSLFAQTYSNFIVHIRDDGSFDTTVEILSKWVKEYPSKILLSAENNIGVIDSFLKLLRNVKYQEWDLFSFCDQDDYWEPRKLEKAVQKIKDAKNSKSTLYCSKLEFVDESLTHLQYSKKPKYIGFENAIVENIATGCSVIIGENILSLMLEANPKHMIMHDWWAYLIATTFGEVIYDETSTIKYRQHDSTVTAWEPGIQKLKTRFINLAKRLSGNFHQGLDSLNQANHFIETYNHIADEQKELVIELLSLRNKSMLLKRFNYITHQKVMRNDTFENLSLKPMILFGLH